ncbi:hypothetical protein OUZ56_002074 [Daphnia magna]|uniref:Uncharacterized protein n=1 Tax=Daphnia magna TaxID=35525 RepID=A0ABR0A532_9CRUS|nr:hypothetical protein OUZ56_002074 [Daphnia magna]
MMAVRFINIVTSRQHLVLDAPSSIKGARKTLTSKPCSRTACSYEEMLEHSHNRSQGVERQHGMKMASKQQYNCILMNERAW